VVHSVNRLISSRVKFDAPTSSPANLVDPLPADRLWGVVQVSVKPGVFIMRIVVLAGAIAAAVVVSLLKVVASLALSMMILTRR
jgi:hypothetical protein